MRLFVFHQHFHVCHLNQHITYIQDIQDKHFKKETCENKLMSSGGSCTGQIDQVNYASFQSNISFSVWMSLFAFVCYAEA